MDKQIVIAIGREFGSGGHEIAETIANDFNIGMLDRSLLEKLANRTGVGMDVMEKYDEKKRNTFLSRKVRGMSNSMEEMVADMQFKYIKEHADAGVSFVVVGRCADAILRDCKNAVSVFVLGDTETKKQRVMEKYNLSEAEALSKMKRHDATRKAYHNSHSKIKWGDSRAYDMCINSSDLGIEKTAKLIEEFVKTKLEME